MLLLFAFSVILALFSTPLRALSPKNCYEMNGPALIESGVREVYLNPVIPEFAFKVYCDQETDGGGWTVIQKRTPDAPGRENFDRNWDDYVVGFGDASGEYWLGLENIHQLTKDNSMELRIDLEDFDGKKVYANYKIFQVGNHGARYRLSIGKYEGNAGDSFLYGESNDNINGMPFSTKDRDNDSWGTGNCAANSKAGWWYNHCTRVNLNGVPYVINPPYEWHGILYYTFKGSRYSLKKTSMMIRPL